MRSPLILPTFRYYLKARTLLECQTKGIIEFVASLVITNGLLRLLPPSGLPNLRPRQGTVLPVLL